MTLTSLRSSLSLPVQINFPRPHIPHYLSMKSSLIHWTTKYLSQFPHKSSVTTCTMPGDIDPSRMTQPSMSSPYPKPNAMASSLADIAVGHTTLSRAPSDDLNILSSPFPPVLDAILPSGMLFSSCVFLCLNIIFSILSPPAKGEVSTKAGLNVKEDAS